MVNRHKRYIGLCLGTFLLVKVLHVVPQVYFTLRSFAGVAYFWTSICLLCICILVEYFYSHRHEYARSPIECCKQEHLIEKLPNEKEIFAALLSLHNHFHSLIGVSGLSDNAFVKMAKERKI